MKKSETQPNEAPCEQCPLALKSGVIKIFVVVVIAIIALQSSRNINNNAADFFVQLKFNF
jgi:hypothetical protein